MKKFNIAVIGLGYVGLPIYIAFRKKFPVIGFDTNLKRIDSIKRGSDFNKQITKEELINKKINITNNFKNIKDCNVFIITVPTPIHINKKPNLNNLIKSSKIIGSVLKKNDLVIYESTVYPGATEEICVKILEKKSGLKLNKDFLCGYSPERINPGDKKRSLEKIIKITSGSNRKALKLVDFLYSKIIDAGTFPVSSIKVAESAKVIENTQRDINIAFMNEISIIFDKLDINKYEVFKAANTKWNFLDFKPGLVGGHCIGVDPYYLSFKAKEMKIDPRIILSGRKINEDFSTYIYQRIKKIIESQFKKKYGISILFLGYTFKADCPDTRNSKVLKVIDKLNKNFKHINAHDPYADNNILVKKFNKINFLKNIKKIKKQDVIIFMVDHSQFKNNGYNYYKKYLSKEGIIIDIKNLFKNNKNYFKL